ATSLSAEEWQRGLHAAERRAGGAPLQYAAGRASFRQLTLDVDERVLIPRPETEQLIDVVLDALRDEPGGIAVDVGTGSGAIALFSAADGMAATARLVREAARSLGARGLLAIEVDARRASLAVELVATEGAYEDVRVQLDLTGRERFVVARRRRASE